MEYTKNSNPNYYEENVEFSNCGSFAFNIEEWYNPGSDFVADFGSIEDWMMEMSLNGYNCDEIADIYAEELAKFIIEDFKEEIREITNFSEVKSNEELIAFRTCCRYETNEDWVPDFDFHFKVFRDGVWKEKCGSCPVRFCTEDDWAYVTRIYNSNTIYFAHQII